MLPPPPIPPTTHSTAMRISTTSPPPADNSKHQRKQQHNESAFVYSPADEAKQSSPTTVKANATMNATTQRLKAMLNRTLTQVSSPYSSSNNNNSNINTSINDYTAQYFGSSELASGSPQLSPPPLHLSSPGSYGSQDDDDFVYGRINDGRGLVGNISEGFDSYATAVATLAANGTANHLEATTATTAAAAVSAFPTATQTVATFMAGNKNRATTIIVYPTVSPESIVIPIVSCIFGFPILAFIVICCLRHRAKMARERDRRRNYDMQDHAVSLVRFSPIHRLSEFKCYYRSSRAISLRPERSLSQGFTSLELDTVVEERCSDVEQTQTEILHPESPMESSTSYKMSLSSS